MSPKISFKGSVYMKIILNDQQISKIICDLRDRIFSDFKEQQEIAIIGVRSRGEVLAQRLCDQLKEKFKKPINFGTLDITLYRDDLNNPQGLEQPTVRSTEIDFDITGKIIILVDDVLFTGRSTRAAMDALVDFGRPKAIKLAVLVDRGGREYPIQADYVGMHADVNEHQSVNVNFVESDGIDQVVVE